MQASRKVQWHAMTELLSTLGTHSGLFLHWHCHSSSTVQLTAFSHQLGHPDNITTRKGGTRSQKRSMGLYFEL